jgi:ATP phosphoribosyltransferase regulatory subunit
VPGIGEALFSGGRYDHLTGRYGFEAPATGFTCNLLSLMNALESQGVTGHEQRDLLVFNLTDDRRDALDISRKLRLHGYAVARDIIKRDLEASLCYAAQSGIQAVLVIGSTTADQDAYRLIRVTDRSEHIITGEQLWQIYPARS